MKFRKDSYDFGIIAARTIPDGVMGNADSPNGLPFEGDFPEDMRLFGDFTKHNILITGPYTAPYVLPLHGTRGRDVIVAGLHAPANAPYVAETLDEALGSVWDGKFGDGRKPIIVGGPRMIRGACEYLRDWNSNCGLGLGKRAVLLMTEIHDTAVPRKYPVDPRVPTLEDLPDNVYEYERKPQPNNVPGRPDFDFVTYVVK